MNKYQEKIDALDIPMPEKLCLIVLAKEAWHHGGLGHRVLTATIAQRTGFNEDYFLMLLYRTWQRGLLIMDCAIFGDVPNCSSYYTLRLSTVGGA